MPPSEMTPAEMASECLKHANFVEPPSWCTCDPEIGHGSCNGCKKGEAIDEWLMATMREIAKSSPLDAPVTKEWLESKPPRVAACIQDPSMYFIHQRFGLHEESLSVVVKVTDDGIALGLSLDMKCFDVLIKKKPTFRDLHKVVDLIAC
jgi:hypothetical protein